MIRLQKVAVAFLQAQQQRHATDYDNSRTWTRTAALTLIQLVEEAFKNWHEIREHAFAQEFLLSLLGNPRAM